MRETETKVLPVLEMSCAVCAGNVESTVQALPGVEKANVNFAAGTLTVTYDHPLSLWRLCRRLCRRPAMT